MRKQTELRTVDIKEDKPSARQQTRTTAETTKPISSLEQSLITKMNEMERWMEESFHRPFLGQSWLPFKSLFHEAGSYGDISPSVDVYEESGAVVVKAELPGMRREDVSVRLVDNNLIISGEKKTEERVEQKDYLRLERSRGSFTRTLAMPEGIDYEGAKASFRDGVLEIRIPRQAPGNTRNIAIE